MKRGRGGSVLAVQTWLSFRKTGHMVIKLTTCIRNPTFSPAFHLNAWLSFAFLTIMVDQGFHSNMYLLWYLGRKSIFSSSWSLSAPDGTARDPRGNRWLRDTIVRFRYYSLQACWFPLVLIFTLRKTCWPLTFQASPWRIQVSQKRRLTGRHKK